MRRAVLALLALLLLAAPGKAQQSLPARVEPGPSAADEAEALYRDQRPREALARLEEYLDLQPDDYQARWKAARAAASVGLLQQTEEEQNPWFLRGIAHGEKAMDLDPTGVDGLYWLTVNKGRLSFTLSPRATAAMAQEVYLLAHRILAVDTLHAGAWNALGKLNFEVMRLSAFERLLARVFLGNDALRRTSWEKALTYQQRAVELDPANPLFRLDLGVVYLFTGRHVLAAEELQRALDLPLRHPGDVLYKREASGLLPLAREGRKP